MKSTAWIFILCIGVIIGAGLHYLAQPRAPLPPLGKAEVSDLIERLRPFADEPNGAWFRNGIAITFYGRGVHLELTMPGGNKYSARADDLAGAVAQLTKPSIEIQNALKGWQQP